MSKDLSERVTNLEAWQPTNGYRKEIHINYAVHVLAH
jgi:hypothetical protein